MLSSIFKDIAEKNIRNRFKELLLTDLDPVIEELVDIFMQEFKIQIETAIYRDAMTFAEKLVVEVRKGK